MRAVSDLLGTSFDPTVRPDDPAPFCVTSNVPAWALRQMEHRGGYDIHPSFAPWSDIEEAVVIAAPAVMQTAAVGPNPWDTKFGPIGTPLGMPVAALQLPPQTMRDGM